MEPDELEAIDTSGDESAGLNTSTPPAAPPTQLSQPTPMENDGSQYAQDPAGGQRQAFHDPKFYEGMGRRGAQVNDLLPAPQQEAIPTMDGPSNPNDPVKHIRGGVKSIVSYLMGGNADPAMVDQAGAQVDPQGQMKPADRNLAAVAQVAETQGDEAAWKLAQANRVAYNAKQAFAYAALNGTPQKVPDLTAAVKAANQAQENVLDGSNVTFAPAQNGVVATVQDGGEPRQIMLSMPAFREFLNPGKEGQLDKLLQNGTVAVLDQLAKQSGPVRRPTPLPQRGAPAQEQPGADGMYEPTAAGRKDEQAYDNQETNFGKTPSTMNLSGSNKIQRGSMEPNNSLEGRAARQFPGITQGTQAEAWMNSERAREGEQQNRLDVAQVKSDVAAINAQGKRDVAATQADADKAIAETKAKAWANRDERKMALEQKKLDQRIAEMQQRSGDRMLHEQMANIRTKRMTMSPLDDQEKALYVKVMGHEPQSLERSGGAPQTQPAQQQPSGKQSKAQSPKDQQALAWANANPQDPRAAKIKAQLGVQ